MLFDSNLVTVYAFITTGRSAERATLAPFKATREAIVSTYRGEILEGTAERVDPELLDGQGRLQRIATGWGEFAA